MKNIFIGFVFLNLICFAHNQHVHQYITREAYFLLKLQLGYDITSMQNNLGGTSSFYQGDRPWQRGYITTGAWREDLDDVVYGYSKENPPTITGLAGVLYEFIAAFGGATPDGFVSTTHFWYSDDGNNLSTTIHGAYDLGILGTHTFDFTVPNAYQKIQKYLNGGWTVHYNYGATVGCPSSAFCVPQSYPIIGIAFEYDNLIEFFTTGKAYAKGFMGIGGYWQYCGNTLIYFGQEFREKIAWEILGRMCHLVQDMSMPAHANLDPHGDNPGLRLDDYENYFGVDYFWNSSNVYTQIGGYLNPYQSVNPLHFLMYTTNQMANHFGSNGPHMKQPNNSFGGNPLSEEISFLNTLSISQFGSPTSMTNPLTNEQILNIRNIMLPQAIRATAGLLYWFANECDLIPPPPPDPPVISSLTQTPDPICSGSYGYVYCNLSQGNGSLTYTWTPVDMSPGVTITPMGSKCKITVASSALASKDKGDYKIMDFVHENKLTCRVSNSAGSNTKTIVVDYTYCGGGGGCPTLAFDNGTEKINENTLLISSLSNPEVDVTDYYLINTDNKIQNGNINFYIHEPEEEHTWFDEIELWELKANHGEFIAVTDEGEFVNFKEEKRPYKYILNDSLDITEELEVNDGKTYIFQQNDLLRIERSQGKLSATVQAPTETYAVVIGIKPPPKEEIVGDIYVSNKNGKSASTASGTYGVGGFYLRENISTAAKRIGELNGDDAVEIMFNNKTELDYFVLTRNLKTIKAEKLELISSEKGSEDLGSRINQTDETYAELLPGEEIRFKYGTKQNVGKKEKIKHVIKAVGRYETPGEEGLVVKKGEENKITTVEEELPKENRLFDNYPNPFNPTTTIKYELKETTNLTLKVYDSLGRLIKTLEAGAKPAGRYDVSFDGSDLSSGMYFYRLVSDKFNFTKKMLLIK